MSRLFRKSFPVESQVGLLIICACSCLIPLTEGAYAQSGQGVQNTPAASSSPASLSIAPAMGSPTPGVQPTTIATPNPLLNRDDSDLTTTQNASQRRSAPPSPSPSSLSEFQLTVQVGTGYVVPIFGADLFNATPSTFAPVDNIPVMPDYVIGPGDELRLQVWGQVNLRGTYRVDRTGSITLPEVGAIQIAGLQFAQLSDFLKSQLGRVYRNFDLNINMGQLRSIQVFVVGQVRKPGNYTIGSMSTLLNALFASGGPLPQGSLRNIQVKRGTQTVTQFDLYDLLLRGDKTRDVRLESGDVIFVPDAGPQVAVLGSVTLPAIYELRGEKTFSQVIALAGGQTNIASSAHIRVERVDHHTERSVIDIDAATGDAPPVQDGDIVTVPAISDRFKDAVTLRGNVATPGRYRWFPGMRISDLIPDREALVTRNYYRRQNQLGQNNLDYRGPLPEGSLGIQPGSPADRSGTRETTASSGGGTSAGAALTMNSGSFGARTDVILSAPDIDWDYAVVARQSAANLTTSLVPFNLGKVILNKDSSQDLELLAGDVVTIFSKADIRVPNAQQTKFVKLEGEFVAAGVYSVLPGEKLRELLARVGGFTPDAYLFASEFSRESVRRLQRQRILEYADALESEINARTSAGIASALTDRDAQASEASAAAARITLARLRQAEPSGRIVLELKPDSNTLAAIPDLDLEDGDRFIVPKVPSSVAVEGQVYNANAFVFQPGSRVRDYLHLAGGPDRTADAKRDFILRADGSVVSHQYTSSRHFGNFDALPMLPGDTIVVPAKIEKGTILRELVSISSIVQGFGLGAAAVQVLK